MVDERLAVFRAIVGMDSLPGGLVDQQNLLVLIEQVQLRCSYRQIGVVLVGLVEEFVVDVELHQIAGLQPGIPGGGPAVDLAALAPEHFLRQRPRQGRAGLGQKAVHPLAGVVGANGEFPHGRPSCSTCRSGRYHITAAAACQKTSF